VIEKKEFKPVAETSKPALTAKQFYKQADKKLKKRLIKFDIIGLALWILAAVALIVAIILFVSAIRDSDPYGDIPSSIIVAIIAFLSVPVLFLLGQRIAFWGYKYVMNELGYATNILGLGARTLNKFVDEQPVLMHYFGIPDANFVQPIPEIMLGRKLASLLPKSIDKSSLQMYKYDGIRAPLFEGATVRALDYWRPYFGQILSPKEKFLSYFEPHALKKYILRALVNMQNHLGITQHYEYERMLKDLSDGAIVRENEEGRKIFLQEKITVDPQLIKGQLIRICNALGINYGDMDMGDFRAARSSWFAVGSAALMGVAIGASILSSIGAAAQEKMFNDASVFYAFNNIVEHFNKTFGLVF